MKYIASVSFGKDSLAMLLKILELKLPLDEVIFYDTGMEFKAIYNLRDKVVQLLNKHNITYTELYPDEPFLYKMLKREVHKRDGSIQYGYGLCGGRCRFGTIYKHTTIRKYLKSKYNEEYREYIGIAADETNRITKARSEHKLLPLVDLNLTEKDCLQYCYEKGYNWEEDGVELYQVLDRVSCWCCTNKNLKELSNYKKYLPEYWKKLNDLTNEIYTNANTDKLKTETEKYLKRLSSIK